MGAGIGVGITTVEVTVGIKLACVRIGVLGVVVCSSTTYKVEPKFFLLVLPKQLLKQLSSFKDLASLALE